MLQYSDFRLLTIRVESLSELMAVHIAAVVSIKLFEDFLHNITVTHDNLSIDFWHCICSNIDNDNVIFLLWHIISSTTVPKVPYG